MFFNWLWDNGRKTEHRVLGFPSLLCHQSTNLHHTEEHGGGGDFFDVNSWSIFCHFSRSDVDGEWEHSCCGNIFFFFWRFCNAPHCSFQAGNFSSTFNSSLIRQFDEMTKASVKQIVDTRPVDAYKGKAEGICCQLNSFQMWTRGKPFQICVLRRDRNSLRSFLVSLRFPTTQVTHSWPRHTDKLRPRCSEWHTALKLLCLPDPKSGHLKGAVSMPFPLTFVDQSTGVLKSPSGLKAGVYTNPGSDTFSVSTNLNCSSLIHFCNQFPAFEASGIQPDQPIVGMCNGGMSSSTAVLSSYLLGIQDSTLYLVSSAAIWAVVGELK